MPEKVPAENKKPAKNKEIESYSINSTISSFMSKCVNIYTKQKEEEAWINFICFTKLVKSPIEQIFISSLIAITLFNRNKEFHISFRNKNNEFKKGLIDAGPQTKIGKYYVDFLIGLIVDKKRVKEVIVECDSQEFHERTEKERQYEKARDRFLNNQGYTVFHFTGSEIMNESFRVAAEVIAYLTDQDISKINQCEDYL